MPFRQCKSMKIFEKNAKSQMRVCDAVRAQSNSMVKCIKAYRHLNTKCPPDTYDSLIEHCEKTNYWVDVMNNDWKTGCELIDSVDHRHVYDLCDYVQYHHQWYTQAGKNDLHYFPKSTYEDIVWTSFGVIILARTQFQCHAIVQQHHGSDDLEKTFCMLRNKNAKANAFGTNQMLSRSQCEISFSL